MSFTSLGVTTCPDITQNDDEWSKAQRDGTQLGKIRGHAYGRQVLGWWACRRPGRAGPRAATSSKVLKKRAAVVTKEKTRLKFNEYVEPGGHQGRR